MVAKIKKYYILPHFDHIARVWVLSNGVEGTPLQQFLLRSLFSFDSIFPAIVWIDKLPHCVEGIFFNVYQGNMKKDEY